MGVFDLHRRRFFLLRRIVFCRSFPDNTQFVPVQVSLSVTMCVCVCLRVFGRVQKSLSVESAIKMKALSGSYGDRLSAGYEARRARRARSIAVDDMLQITDHAGAQPRRVRACVGALFASQRHYHTHTLSLCLCVYIYLPRFPLLLMHPDL